MVVQVMQLTRGRHLLSPDRTGSPDQGGCASGDAVDTGGFWWSGGLVVGGGCRWLCFRGCHFFPALGADVITIRQRGPALRAEGMGVDRRSGGIRVGVLTSGKDGEQHESVRVWGNSYRGDCGRIRSGS